MNNDQIELNHDILELDEAAIETVSGANISAVTRAFRRAVRLRRARTTDKMPARNN